MIKSKSAIQILKFFIVGISNTLLTALTIWLLLKVLGCSDYISNIVGYFVGLINRYLESEMDFCQQYQSKRYNIKIYCYFCYLIFVSIG